ncbi:hypothetical protein L598_002200000520 [Mesorhizobium sp. J18]|uniref:hypothetical protein n=1 Tax=Mesorhizobium sp. J18 TaxID=935263 RepID=UPI00119B8A9F|nr:hypothetical protein [Mesorhizobium sp. J18]TWG97168.1 hypothetical protein L598_002200000520 [Mesorhizobium sp. J18]
MIQSILFFSLGFLCAAFIALMVAPALWRRAVELTRRRIEASVPLSAAELQAEKDRLRAEHAMQTRRLEMKLKSLTEKSTAQSLEIVRLREEADRLAQDLEKQAHTNGHLDSETRRLGAVAADHARIVEELTEKLAGTERMAEERGKELERLERLYEEASFASSSRQIELVARESEIEKLSEEIKGMRAARKEADRVMRQAVNDRKAAESALQAERKRAAELETKLERMFTTLSDREEKLERQARELDRLREEIKAMSAAGSTAGQGEGSDDKALRDQISTLAAEVVHLTALLEGPESQIYKALGMEEPAKGKAKEAAFPSLADRVRALQKAAQGS